MALQSAISDVKPRLVWVVDGWVTVNDTNMAFFTPNIATFTAIYRGQLGTRNVEMGYLMRCLIE